MISLISIHLFQGNGEEVRGAVDAALNCGYRMIDTAFSYQNEADIGHVIHEKIKAKKIKRQDLFVISKVTKSTDMWSEYKKLYWLFW